MRYRFGRFVLDTDSYQLLDGDAPIHLEPGAFDVLSFLVSHRDRVVSKNELLDSVWGDRYVSESALTSRIRDARRVLGDDGTEQRMIRTTHGRGYRFVSEVEELGPGRTASLTDAPTMEQEIRFCTSSDGGRLAYATVGSGPVLVRAAHWLTHVDYDWRSPVWHHWLTGIGAHRTLVRYDERGCGLSDHDMVDCSLDAWVDDLKSVADDFGLDRFPVLGVSQGGAVAMAFASRFPERVSKLVLLNTYLRGPAVRARSRDDHAAAEIQYDLIRLGWERDDDPTFRRFFAANLAPDAPNEVHAAFAELLRRTTSAENALRLMRTWSELDVSDEATTVRCPALVLHCRNDLRVPFDQGLEVAAAIPDSRFVTLDTRNHLFRVEEPAWTAFIDAMNSFLDEDDG